MALTKKPDVTNCYLKLEDLPPSLLHEATPLYFIAEGGLCLKFNQTAIEIPLDRVAIISIASQLGNVLSKSLRLQIVTLEV